MNNNVRKFSAMNAEMQERGMTKPMG